MKEEDDMLELLDEEDLGSTSPVTDKFELTEDEAPESDDSEEPELTDELAPEPEKPEKEGIEIDVRYIIIGVAAIAAIILAIVFVVLPMIGGGDKAPEVVITPSTVDEEVFLFHSSGDPLKQEHLSVLIDGNPVPADKLMLMGGGTWPWSQGTTLRIDTTGYAKPATINVLYIPVATEYPIVTVPIEPVATSTPTPAPAFTPAPTNQTQPGTPGPGVITPAPSQAPGQTAPPMAPTAQGQTILDASPTSGQAPLSVRFTDQTVGCLKSRTWNFDDGMTSNKKAPLHIYPFPGTYNVSLANNFCDPEDNPDVIPTKTITVSQSSRKDTLSQGTGLATILAGGKFFFTVKGPGKTIRISGQDRYLNQGDLIELDLGSGGKGGISVISNAFIECNFENVTMTINGKESINGWITNLNINQYEQFETADLQMKIKVGRDGAKGLVNAQPAISALPGQEIIFNDIGVDSSGKLLFSVQDSAGFSFRGGVGSYEVTTPPPL
ncbi:MAG TPA: PKD domain-containing protein [Methanospirillum sp.]|nr:PKD domain-containing protein [Methanospirillum sp.]